MLLLNTAFKVIKNGLILERIISLHRFINKNFKINILSITFIKLLSKVEKYFFKKSLTVKKSLQYVITIY